MFLLAGLLGTAAAAAEIPYPVALDAAAVTQDRLDHIHHRALVLGNGDLQALLWEDRGSICLRVSKNDLWDARVDTSEDPPMLTVDVPNQQWSGGGYPPSWRKPYPHPRCAAVVRIGRADLTPVGWRRIREQGEKNDFTFHDGVLRMGLTGKSGASSGYRYEVQDLGRLKCETLTLRLSGTPNARYYLNAPGVKGEWRDTPTEPAEVSFALSAGVTSPVLELYIMTKDDQPAENRFHRIWFAGGGQQQDLDLQSAALPLLEDPAASDVLVREARLDLRRAAAFLTDRNGRATTVRALADRNAFLIEGPGEVSVEEILAPQLPPAKRGETGGVQWLHMQMPGDMDYPGMEYALAVAARGERKALTMVTSFDTQEPVREAACRLAQETMTADATTLVTRHEAAWTQFWSASGVALDDPDFQLWWYRMVYYLCCFARPGAMPAGLFAGMAGDSPPWHGDYHHNYNAWQPYWTPFIINHPELADPWVRYMNEMLPRMKWLAKTTYDCEGACIGISSFAFEPDPAKCQSVNRRQIAIPPYGYTLGMAGMSAQVLWHSHLYRPDPKYLEAQLYPVIREVALFYCSLAEKCPRDGTGRVQFGPSYSPEHGRFGVANVPFDLAYARFILNAAICAAGELGRDEPLAERFRQSLALLPPYPTAADEAGQPVVVDWTGCQFREIKQHNITVPAVPVFPAEQVTWFSPEPEKELFRNTLRQTRHRGCNSTIMLSVAKARLSMLEALEDARQYYRPEVQPNGMFHWPMHGFYLSESVGLAAMISEFLVQSVDHTIRVFPCWPTDKDARFANLRAQGGFLISAEQKAGTITKLEITSTVGGPLRLVNPWTGQVVERETTAGEKMDFQQE
jgi:hypothetical protein